MSKKLFSIISFVLLTALAGSALAADVKWTNNVGDELWTTPGNWDPCGPPGASDKAKLVKLPGPLIDANMAAVCQWLVVGDGADGELHMTGGTLDISGVGDSWTIVAYGPTDVGTFTMDGGTVTTSNRVYVGFQGKGTINMNGGTINIGGTFGIGYSEGLSTSSEGYVYLNSGTINTTDASKDFFMSSPAGCIGTLDISGSGTLNLAGDKQTTAQGYIDNGWIIAYGGMGDVVVAFDGNTTTLTGIINPNKAKAPYPANNAVDVPPYVVLTWVPGDTAVTHDIYFGTDANAVSDANTSTVGIYQGSQVRDANTFPPPSLELGGKYYWRIDEVNEPNVYEGKVWQFTVADYALVDDFEEYVEPNDMLFSWSNAGTGGALSLATSDGHDEAQAMKFDYDNSSDPNYSEAQTADIDFDWTIAGVLAIDIWYKGVPGNAAEQMYVALEDDDSNPVAVVENSDINAALATDWQVWRIELSDFTGVNLGNIKKFYVGFGDRTNPVAGGTGTVYFDDIRLHPTRCINKPLEDLDDDCDVDFKDFGIMAGNWMASSPI